MAVGSGDDQVGAFLLRDPEELGGHAEFRGRPEDGGGGDAVPRQIALGLAGALPVGFVAESDG